MSVLDAERVAPRSVVRYQPNLATDQARQTQPGVRIRS